MTDWAAFAGVTTAATLLLLALARVSSVGGAFPTREEVEWLDALPDDADHLAATTATTPGGDPERFSSGLLFVNVLVTHGLFLLVLVGAALYARVPASAFGLSVSLRELALGVGFGLLLSVLNTGAGALAEASGYAPSEELRGMLAPDSAGGWLLLMGGTLPLVAVFEEALFRAALVGAFAAGLGASPWALAVVSSVAFALAHEAQGPAGVAVTGTLGFVLAAGYIATGSFLVVAVAHYLVNAVELVVYEGLGVERLGA
ncbi:CPBP family intramembrane glutamic endopeptidase [Halosegnis marinus]|uniref:CPBP family intramembrane glutamic endopeptidase n=1 Tax=Halosegnis marinus TaxID=3034023 RepID=A0ABD5ZR10_9EURY|nr:CPBP family intramembrane glutamic endopeptidase [Halosegnis sp. DT85]